MGKSKKNRGPKWDVFFYHVILFICVHLLFVKFVGILPLSDLGSDSYLGFIKDHFLNQGINIYQNDIVNKVSGIWKTILIIHLIIEIIEFLLPKKRKDASSGRSSKVEVEEMEKHTEGNTKETQKNYSRSRAWIYLIIAGLLEIVWATALKMDMLAGPVVIALIVSFDLLIKSVKRLGVGIAYAVFTGIGTVGMVMVDVLVFQETMSFIKVLLIIMLISFIIGLILSTETSKGEQR